MRTASIVVPLVSPACFGLVGPLAARRLPPRQATWLLSTGAVLAALSAIAVLALLGFVLVGQLPVVASVCHWSASVLRDDAPTEPGVGAVSLLVVLMASGAVAFAAARQGSATLQAYRTCKALSRTASNLVIVNDARVGATAVPGRPGRIVVARSLLAALSGSERRALLAHERAHLDHGHHWHRSAVSLATAAYPLLAPLRGAILHATERWADEEAAAVVGDRRRVAGALARAALITPASPGRANGQLAAAAHAVPERVAALLSRAPEPQPLLSLLMVAMLLVGLVASVVVLKETEHLFELAGRVYRGAHGY